MNTDVNVIWRRGDGEIPERAKKVTETAQGELLLKALELPSDVIDEIRYNADKNAQTVNHYISTIVLERLSTAS